MADEEIVDPLSTKRQECQESDAKVLKLKVILDKCTERVTKTKTEETCFEEVIDYVNSLDHCAMHGLFSKLK